MIFAKIILNRMILKTMNDLLNDNMYLHQVNLGENYETKEHDKKALGYSFSGDENYDEILKNVSNNMLAGKFFIREDMKGIGIDATGQGVIVSEGSVVSMGVYIGQSTKIVNRSTGEITYGKVPPYSVVVPGTLPDKKNPSAPSLSCAVIIKQVDEKTRSKTSINDLLRDTD